MDRTSYLLLGLSMLMAVGYSVGPLNILLLSKVATMLSEKRHEELNARLIALMAAITELSIFVCLQLLVFANVLVRLWVGDRLAGGTFVIRIMLLAVPFYLFYSALSSVIDAASTFPYDTRNVFLSLGVFLVLALAAVKLSPANKVLEAVTFCLVVTLVVLAGLTAHTIYRLYHVRVSAGLSLRFFLLSLIFGAVSLFIHWACGFREGWVQLVAIQVVIGGCFLLLLVKLRSPWLSTVLNSAFGRT